MPGRSTPPHAARWRAWPRPAGRARRARAAATRASSRSRACRPERGCSTSAAARSACARWSPTSTSPASTWSSAPATRARSCARTRAAGLPFADGEFDLVYCSSVIEHVPPARRAAFAAELRRVGRGWYVQTPALLVPDRAALAAAGRALAAGARCAGATGGWARPASWEEISLLRRARARGAVRARAAPSASGRCVKSWVACAPLGSAQPLRRLMSLLTPLMHEEREQHDPRPS